ncbi:DUF5412 family protein [Cohnella zeiphila]|nr:DUF5412 family protein [Cohnella zeiphila]
MADCLPFYVILLFSFLTLTLGVIGFFDKTIRNAKFRSRFTTIFSIILIFVLFITMLFTTMFSGAKELLTTVHSPDGKYTVKFYHTDAGGMGTFGVLGELNGPLWFKKKIYVEKRVDQVDIEWKDNHTILINNHKLDLRKGETLFL